MNDILRKEQETHYVPHFIEVKVKLTPGEYEEIERRFGFGSVQTRIQWLVHEKLWNDQDRWVTIN